jgi:aminopeptidase-like protein
MPNSKSVEGQAIYNWAKEIFPFPRSLTGEGVRKTLQFFKKILPELQIHEVPTGTQCFDWTVPQEWNVQAAFVADEAGNKVIDFAQNNLHLMGYSEPVDKLMSFGELDKNLYSLPEKPEAIPYVTSYYKRNWGFCLQDSLRKKLQKDLKKNYRVVIQSTLKDGNLTYGEVFLKGTSTREVVLSTYICHPSMANNEISGPCVATAIADWIKKELPTRRLSYRVLFLPETIGSIYYISKNLEALRTNVEAGFVLSCLGDNRHYSYVASRYGNNLADKIALRVLKEHAPSFKKYSFLERGSDERQYCSPGVDLPFTTLCRSKFGEYPEYHTSLDNLDFISAEGLQGSFDLFKKIVEVLEKNKRYKSKVFCEPQLGKRGLYPSISTRESNLKVRQMMNFLAYCDGTNDLSEIAQLMGAKESELTEYVDSFVKNSVIS